MGERVYMCISTQEVVGTAIENKWVPAKKIKWFGTQLMKNGAWTSGVYVCVDLIFDISDNIIYVIIQFEFFGWCHHEHYQMLLPMSTSKKCSFSWLIFKEKLLREVVHPMACKNLIHAFVFNIIRYQQ